MLCEFELQPKLKLNRIVGASSDNLLGVSNVYHNLVRKKMFNYFFHFEAILIYLWPNLKRSPFKQVKGLKAR